jgi:hypothetical protein
MGFEFNTLHQFFQFLFWVARGQVSDSDVVLEVKAQPVLGKEGGREERAEGQEGKGRGGRGQR